MKIFTALTTFALVQGTSCLKFFNSTNQLPSNMTDSCKDALTSDIECSPRLITASNVMKRLEHNTTILEEYCNDQCTKSLKDWNSDVHACCGDTRYDFGFSTVLNSGPAFLRSGSDMADSLLWAHNVSCLTDEGSHEFCAPKLTNGTFEKCADCSLKYLAAMMSSWYGVGRAPSVSHFDALLEECCVDKANYPVTNWTWPEVPPPTPVRNVTCYGGCYYTVEENDTCDSISYDQGVSYDHFIYQNGLDRNCKTLSAGREVCVGSPCALYVVQENDTCNTILSEANFTLTELLAWNPTIHRNCDNLSWLEGHAICVSPPGTDTYDVNITVSWGQAWTSPAWGSWAAAETVGAAWNATEAASLAARAVAGAPLPTMTAVYNATAESIRARLVEENCPVTADDLERGFEWYYLSDGCQSLLGPYCSPDIDGSPPVPPVSGFPNECLPAAVMKW